MTKLMMKIPHVCVCIKCPGLA